MIKVKRISQKFPRHFIEILAAKPTIKLGCCSHISLVFPVLSPLVVDLVSHTFVTNYIRARIIVTITQFINSPFSSLVIKATHVSSQLRNL